LQTAPSMNGKSFKRLTLDGMAAHIANALLLAQKVGTKNDCKLAIAYVIRAYQRQLFKKMSYEIPFTSAAREAQLKKEAIELEHSIPVGCVMNVLFHYANGSTHEEMMAQTVRLLKENTVLAWVTPQQHGQLNGKYQSSMPVGFDTYPWQDVWARYVAAEVELPEGAFPLENLESYRKRTSGSPLRAADFNSI